jgi:hypothetical protein
VMTGYLAPCYQRRTGPTTGTAKLIVPDGATGNFRKGLNGCEVNVKNRAASFAAEPDDHLILVNDGKEFRPLYTTLKTFHVRIYDRDGNTQHLRTFHSGFSGTGGSIDVDSAGQIYAVAGVNGGRFGAGFARDLTATIRSATAVVVDPATGDLITESGEFNRYSATDFSVINEPAQVGGSVSIWPRPDGKIAWLHASSGVGVRNADLITNLWTRGIPLLGLDPPNGIATDANNNVIVVGRPTSASLVSNVLSLSAATGAINWGVRWDPTSEPPGTFLGVSGVWCDRGSGRIAISSNAARGVIDTAGATVWYTTAPPGGQGCINAFGDVLFAGNGIVSYDSAGNKKWQHTHSASHPRPLPDGGWAVITNTVPAWDPSTDFI